jgi:hypothetical protein
MKSDDSLGESSVGTGCLHMRDGHDCEAVQILPGYLRTNTGHVEVEENDFLYRQSNL